ncbi:hypothetical protein ACFYTQ_36505 [Nocardia sp. NPDC004068]|uniref:hypothetical protein n=1 Tax=Nocardia sp. NPDC004068 TaxID=3364303 RepID=UPI0036A7D7B0
MVVGGERRREWVRLVVGVLVAVGLVVAAVMLLSGRGTRPAYDPVVPLPVVVSPWMSASSGPSPM